jgi:hypothetical protein
MNTFEIAKSTQQLPSKLEDVIKFIYVGEPGLAWGRKVLQQMKTAGIVDKEHGALLEEAQRLGDLVLDAYVRLGELLPSAEEAKKLGGKAAGTATKGLKNNKRAGIEVDSYLPDGVDSQKALIARKLKAHPEAVAKIKAEARKNEDIPSKSAAIYSIKFEAEKKRRIKAETEKIESKAVISLDEQQYINALERCINLLPQNPPKVWNEKGFNIAQGYAKLLIKRLSIFDINKNQIGVK